jgi:hypothetical protein
MFMPNATYSFLPKAGHGAACVRGIDVATPDENVTLAVRDAR